MNSLFKNIIIGFFSDIGLTILKIFKIIFIIPIIIKYTSAGDYGMYITYISLIGIFDLLYLSPEAYLVKELSKKSKNNYLINTSVASILMNIFIILLFFIFINTLNSFDFSYILSVLIFIYLLNRVSSIPSSILVSKQKMGFINITKSATVLLDILISVILLIQYNLGILSIIYAELVGVFINLIVLTIFTKKELLIIKLKIHKKTFNSLLSYSINFYFTKIAQIGLQYFDNIMIYYFFNAELVAIYNVTIKLPILFSRELSGKISSNLFPGLSNLVISASTINQKQILFRLFNLTVRFSIISFVITLLLNKHFVLIWVGNDLFGGFSLNFIFSLIVLFEIIYLTINPYMLVYGDIKKFGIISIVELIVNIVLSVILSQLIGIIGIALGSLLSKVFTTLWFSFNNIFKIFNLTYKETLTNVKYSLNRSILSSILGLVIFLLLNNHIDNILLLIIIPLILVSSNILFFDYDIIIDRSISFKEKIKIILKGKYVM